MTKIWTDTAIAKIVPKNKRFTKQIDTNLFIYIEPTGSRGWRVRYTPAAGQKQKMKKIGIFNPNKPEHMTLIAAKEQAVLIRGAVREEKSIEQVTKTFRDIAEEWLEDYTGARRNSTVESTEYRYKNYIEKAPFYTKRIANVNTQKCGTGWRDDRMSWRSYSRRCRRTMPQLFPTEEVKIMMRWQKYGAAGVCNKQRYLQQLVD